MNCSLILVLDLDEANLIDGRTNSKMSEYIKGYKVDREKLKARFARREDGPECNRFMGLWQKFPLPFKYLEVGQEPDGKTALVLVLEDDDDRERLEKTDIPSLGESYTQLFTPGI